MPKKVGENEMDIFKIFKGKKNTKEPIPEKEPQRIYSNLEQNLTLIKEKLGNANDLLIRKLRLQGADDVAVAILGIDGLIDTNLAEQFIVHVLAIDLSLVEDSKTRSCGVFQSIFESRISMIDAQCAQSFDDLYTNLLNGHIIVLVDEVDQLMMFDCKGWQMRSISEPQTEQSLYGPKDCFVETIRTNTATLRRRIKDPNLRFDAHVVGTVTQTDVFVAYIEGIANPELVQTVNKRIKSLDIDGLVDSSELMQLIEDHHLTIFPRLTQTERPDKVTAAVMQGSVAILFDGSPFVTVGPAYFITMFQITDDYYSRPLIATLTRILRYASFLLVILVPGLYVAISTYHQEMIPTVLLITIINQRSSNPFPTYIETLVILVLFEIIREAALRKPNVVGDSMTIVGSLIIGQTIVEAGLVSYMVIIIVSITSIAGFILSSSRLNNATRILTFIFLFLGAAFGLYGITIGFIMLILHLASLTTLDQPYLAAMAPFNLHDQEDQFLRLPFSWMKYRPKIFKTGNRTRHNMKNPVRKEE
ncbi:Bacillus/Clostridium GerA spore germination protein [Turicibacter sanguinis]|nr:Bacillus/Clostridium GerA spore germination protein [Turicibacter sanguinis]